VYEKALADGKAESAELLLLLIREVIADNAAGFAATLGARDPRLTMLYRIVCPALPVWEVLDWAFLTLANVVVAVGARAITRLLLGFFEFIPNEDSLTCALASGDEELIREIWVHTPDEVRTRLVGTWLKNAAELQVEVPFHWLLGLASDANLDEAVELMVEERLAGALCEVEATGFDLTRMRPARAFASWIRTMSLVTIPTPSLPSVPASTLLAWQFRVLRSWEIPCDEPKALASGRVLWADPEPRIDFRSWMKVSAKRVLFLAQTGDGVVFGFFANCPLSGEDGGRDPALKSAILVLEHPTGEQRKWQVQVPSYDVMLREEGLGPGGAGFGINTGGYLFMGRAPEFGMTEVDASFINLKRPNDDGWPWAEILHWELWSV
jgi:hypothetical protein